MTRAAHGTAPRIPHAGLAPLFFAVLLALLPRPAVAHTTVFTNTSTCTITGNLCQALSLFGVLTSSGTATADTLTINGGWTYNVGLGVGTGDKLSKGGTNTANGIVDFSDAVTSGNSCTSNNFCGNGTWSGTQPSGSQTIVGTAESQLNTIISALSGMSFTGAAALSTSGTFNVETNGGIKLYNNTTAFTQSGAITLGCGNVTCNANDLVIIKLTGGTATLNNTIQLNDGLTADQVIWYIPSNSLTIAPTSSVTVSGDFFTASSTGAYALGGTGKSNTSFTFYGRIFSQDGAITFNSKGGTENDDGEVFGTVPEPGTWAMMAGGLGIAFWLHRRRRHAARKEPA